MKKIFFSIAMLTLLILISCNSSVDSKVVKQKAPENEVSPAEIEVSNEIMAFDSAEQIPVGSQQIPLTDSVAKRNAAKSIPYVDWDKKIIKTASLKLEVPDFKKYNDIVYKTVRQLGGYIAQEDQSLTAEKNETVITIKVPVAQFETMMNELPGSDTKLIERKINTDDVTGKIVDTKSRLETKKEMRLKYLEFLKQSKNMKEVLEVQGEVNDIQEGIEAAAGQVNYLSHQSALSTINLTFYQLIAGYKPDVADNPSFATRLTNAFKTGGTWIADLFVGMVSVWPLLLIICVSVFIWRKARNKKLLAPITGPANKNNSHHS